MPVGVSDLKVERAISDVVAAGGHCGRRVRAELA